MVSSQPIFYVWLKKGCVIIKIIAALFALILLALPSCTQTAPTDASSAPYISTETSKSQDVGSTSAYNTETIVDFSEQFQGIDGCAVIYAAETQQFWFYQQDMCKQRFSPFSTFKIFSALLGLDAGIIEDGASIMNYDGTQYAKPSWNGNLTLDQAFSSSCIWYFRQIIDTVGPETVQKALDSLSYGNCDISQWDGSGINQPEQLNGFWLDSSLLISPLEQVQALVCIFEGDSIFSSGSVDVVRQLMLVEEDHSQSIYGKTGTGSNGRAWFVGFSQSGGTSRYFAVFLNDPTHACTVSGSAAREIALSLNLWKL